MREATPLVADDRRPSFYFMNSGVSAGVNLSNQQGTPSFSPLETEITPPPAQSFINRMWNSLSLRRSDHAYQQVSSSANPLEKLRKVPIKVEPKVFFANERTFLAWLHMSVTLASISVAIVAFADANEWSQIYGLMLMPVAICFCVYSLFMYIKRAGMIRRKEPGPYEDIMGPVVIAVLLGLSVAINFSIKLYEYNDLGGDDVAVR